MRKRRLPPPNFRVETKRVADTGSQVCFTTLNPSYQTFPLPLSFVPTKETKTPGGEINAKTDSIPLKEINTP
jgi:hypothetical protein